MADIKKQIILNLGNGLTAMAPYAGGSIPGNNTSDYADWIRFLGLAQEDAAERGFWRRLLIPTPLTIPLWTSETDQVVVELPDNFHKINGIYALFVDDEDWSEPDNESEIRLYVFMDPADAKWKVRIFGYRSETAKTATLWYFYNPPVPTTETDPFYLNGQMILFGALKEYARKARQPGSLDDYRLEYENRFNELLGLEVLPSKQELAGWTTRMPYREKTHAAFVSSSRYSRR